MTRPFYVLGINAFHGDAAAALLRDGALVGAIAEERLRRIKHCAGFPTLAVQALLRDAGIRGPDVQLVAIGRQPRAHRWRKVWYTMRHRPSPGFVRERLRHAATISDIKVPLAHALEVERSSVPRVHFVEHHRAHLASAFFGSPFQEAACAAFDGFGDFVSTSVGVGSGTAIDVMHRVYFPHSLGIFYSALTQYLGFHSYGDEYKVMALAAYGKPKYARLLEPLVRLTGFGFTLDLRYFRHWSSGAAMEWAGGPPTVETLYSPELESVLGPARDPQAALTDRDADLASSLQHVFERAYFHVLRHLWERTHVPQLCLSGGCALNGVANGKVRTETPFRHLYIPPAAADDGTAVGAAWHAWHHLRPHERASGMPHAYWGPAPGDVAMPDPTGLDLRDHEIVTCQSTSDVVSRVAQGLADGQVIGWYQGRAEWGPRALGHRSILGDPRRTTLRHYLNAQVKGRESFRPFAPAVPIEAFEEFFGQGEPNPFMAEVRSVREEKRGLIPAVVHIDGTARVQAVRRTDDPVFHELLTAFGKITGVPMLLNTSLNEHEPIVETPAEAVDCFARARLDAIVIGTTILRRRMAPGVRERGRMLDITVSDRRQAGAS